MVKCSVLLNPLSIQFFCQLCSELRFLYRSASYFLSLSNMVALVFHQHVFLLQFCILHQGTPPSALLTLSLATHRSRLLLMKLPYSLPDPIISSHVSNAMTNFMTMFFNNLILFINDLFNVLVIILCQFGYLLYLLNRIILT